MKTPEINAVRQRQQRGFSLIELMISMTIGFIIVMAIGYVYLNSRQSYRTADNMSRIQENARFALNNLAAYARMAGYIGCGNLQNTVVNTIANGVTNLTTANAIVGYDNGAAWVNPTAIARAAGDVLTVKGAFESGVPLTGNLAPANANVQINGNPYGFVAGDVLVVTNCTNADVFRATSVSNAGGTVTIAHSNSSNTGNRIGTYETADAFVMKMEEYTYFIGLNATTGRRALYRTSLNAGTIELVDNVEDMQIEFGLDTDNDSAADSYSSAAGVANWSQVVSLRVSLLTTSPENSITAAAQKYNFNGATVTATDRRVYRVFTTTIGLRNRLP